MPGFSDYMENAVLDFLFRGVAYTPPATLYIALSTADPGETGAGLSEPGTPGATPDALNGYNRVALTTADWTRTLNVVSNSVTVTFPTATADWGNITHFAIMDAQSGGNVLMSNVISPAQSVVTGNTLIFDPGAISISLD
ncbi:hypothetical protein D6833_09335 [Candidatus Parcubacteria bacterium]|nr:MAG: hypothetical protein D6833_09335 [Candidatus Parcubacteria bacterium]